MPFKPPSHLFKTVYNQEIIIAPLGKTFLPSLKSGVGIFANAVIDHFGSVFTQQPITLEERLSLA